MSILENCIRIAIDDIHVSSSPCAESVIVLIEDGHGRGYFNEERRDRLIKHANDAVRHQRTRLRQREIIMRSSK